jgi:pantothenate synthetase
LSPVADAVIVTSFLNPLQFNTQEEYEAYPRALARDDNLLLGATYVFALMWHAVTGR